MHYSTIVLAFAALAAAAPGSMTARSPNTKTGILRRQTSELCGTDTPLCCEVDVEGVADLDCTRRMSCLGLDHSLRTDPL